MSEDLPPPLTGIRESAARPRRWKIGIAAAIVGGSGGLCVCALVVLRLTGLIEVYKIPTASMAPAINRDDKVLTEGITYVFRRPQRGDIVIFKGDELPRARPGERYTKRLVGLPGDRLRISNGTLYINEEPASFHNKDGIIHYTTGLGAYLRSENETLTVPEGSYFVLGDNSANSADSRMWGAVSARWVTGRAVFCYFPAQDAGWIH